MGTVARRQSRRGDAFNTLSRSKLPSSSRRYAAASGWCRVPRSASRPTLKTGVPSMPPLSPACGVNRVSLGVQSFDPDVLVYPGTTPQTRGGDRRRCGPPATRGSHQSTSTSFSVAPIESLESWRFSVSAAPSIPVPTMSRHMRSLSRLGTALSRAVQSGAAAPDDDDQADKYELFDAAATLAGLEHYEVSNWARPGHTLPVQLDHVGARRVRRLWNGGTRLSQRHQESQCATARSISGCWSRRAGDRWRAPRS